MKTLLVLRHAKSSWESAASRDFDRPLASRGERDAPRMGKALERAGVDLDLVVSSPAKRAKQTAELFVREAGYEREILFEPAIYEASADALMEVIAALPKSADTVLLVGHNPGFEELIGSLCSESEPARVRVPTAALACIEIEGEWSDAGPGAGTLQWMLIPKIL